MAQTIKGFGYELSAIIEDLETFIYNAQKSINISLYNL